MSEEKSPEKLKVTELRALLSARGLSPKGNKPVLVERLREALGLQGENPVKNEDDNGDEVPIESEQTDDKMEEADNRQQMKTEEESEHTLPDAGAAQSDNTSTVNETLQSADDSTDAVYGGADETLNESIAKEDEQTNLEQTKSETDKLKQEENIPEEKRVENVHENVKSEDLEAEHERLLLQEDQATSAETNSAEKMDESLLLEDEPQKANDSVAALYGGKNETMNETSGIFWADVSMESNEGFQIESTSEPATKRPRERSQDPPTARKVEKEIVEDEPQLPADSVVLDWYNSDLNLEIATSDFCTATPLTEGGFAYMWAAARATHGFTSNKVCFEVKVLENLDVAHLEGNETNPHVVRVGWSVDGSSLLLGEDQLSYGYGGTGKISTNNQFQDYGTSFKADDVITAYLDAAGEVISISFAVNGQDQGIAFSRARHELKNQALFPHVMTKNCRVCVNFGQLEEPWFPLKADFVLAGKTDPASRVRGSLPPDSRGVCELIMMIGLPASGKTTWASEYAKQHPEKRYNILGTNAFLEKMRVDGLPRRRNYHGRWEALIDKCQKCLTVILEKAGRRRRNYILDQTNVYPNARRRKLEHFAGFQRRAVVIMPTEAEQKRREEKRERDEGKDVPSAAVLEMKANFRLPESADHFDSVDYTELKHDEALVLVKKYAREARNLGYGAPPIKRARVDVHQAVNKWDRDYNRGRFQAHPRGPGNWGPPPRNSGPPPPRAPPSLMRTPLPPAPFPQRNLSPPRRNYNHGPQGFGNRPPQRPTPFPWITPPPNFGASYQEAPRRAYPNPAFERRDDWGRQGGYQGPPSGNSRPNPWGNNSNNYGGGGYGTQQQPQQRQNQSGWYNRNGQQYQRRY